MAFVVQAVWTAPAEHIGTVLDAVAELAPLCRQESGCQFYQAYRDPSEANVIRLFEIYDDDAAYATHGESEHVQRLGFGVAIPLLSSRERAFYTTLDV